MLIEILCTGDEILSGKTVNTNYSHIARRLVENGFEVCHGTIVGDDRASLLSAFGRAAERADAVIVNGGLGPTVDDLSQEVAAEAAGVALELHQPWLDRMTAWYRSRGRVMPDNNRKQAMLPAGAEFIDNPIGTACGFAVTIAGARFFFTPGVPREMRRMLEEQLLPRLRTMRGGDTLISLKRFHSFGIGESRADRLLDGVESLAPAGRVKLGFQSHYPQLETKLVVRGEDPAEMTALLEPVADAVRDRLGAYILAEDDETVEGRIVASLAKANQTLAVMEMHTGGAVGGRLLAAGDGPRWIRSCQVSHDLHELARLAGEPSLPADACPDGDIAKALAEHLRDASATHHALVVLSAPGKPAEDGTEARSLVAIGIAGPNGTATREAVLPGSREWFRLGAGELALDCLRRHLAGAPVYQKIDFEQH